MPRIAGDLDPLIQCSSRKPLWFLSNVSRKLAKLLYQFNRSLTVANASIDVDRHRPSKDPFVARVLDESHVSLRLWMHDIVPMGSEEGITVFDALNIISERQNGVHGELVTLFDTMIDIVCKLESASDVLSSMKESSVKILQADGFITNTRANIYLLRREIQELARNLQVNMDKLAPLKKPLRDGLFAILQKEIEQSKVPDGGQTEQCVLCIARPDDPVRPHEVFDYIFGSRSGGGILLGVKTKEGNPSRIQPYLFRTYHPPEAKGQSLRAGGKDFAIWQVIQATFAALPSFPPASIDGQSFVGGKIGLNSLTTEAFNEVMAINRGHKTSTTWVIIGSGGDSDTAAGSPFPNVEAARDEPDDFADTETTHDAIPHGAHAQDSRTFRFIVPDLKADLDDWDIPNTFRIYKATRKYLEQADVTRGLQTCANVLVSQW
ncbi:hypothetical protein O1611_g6421 [Lasiodiplodia mahajangana]|uniref:Uncharacterized protein n=1 Tax=Lasiodiplodia mahajangana TaxID=1108764 RepID=A0ACC2JIB6_9PEZI|nr:hypothetical protein O1611_g6421 [Lasiodiplodia mahajangana]